MVRRLHPEVAVPELSDDVSTYPQVLEQHRYFQVLSVAAEDFRRTDYYRANADRRLAETYADDMEAFLHSLQMVARLAPIDSTTYERAAQLIQRSNQFNLTTRRRSASQVFALISDTSWITRTVCLADRFGDNGLVSVLLARIIDDVLDIDTWLMSCRVLKRGVEQFLLNDLCALAQARGLRAIRGEYVPTPKNGLVRDHYRGLGFRQVDAATTEGTTWILNLTEKREPFTTFITEASAWKH